MHTASDDEYWKKLKEKLREEADEFVDGEGEEELADILEVVRAICDFKGIGQGGLEAVRKKKAEERGGFSSRVILDETRRQ